MFIVILTPIIPHYFKGEGEDEVLKGLRPFNLPLIDGLFKLPFNLQSCLQIASVFLIAWALPMLTAKLLPYFHII